jgi:hypothetical protein
MLGFALEAPAFRRGESSLYVIFLHDAGRLYFETSSVTRKVRNIERAGKASMLVQGKAASGRGLMVSVEGSARLLRGDEAHTINHRLRSKYIKGDVVPAIDRIWERLDDVAVEITPTTWRSWQGGVFHEVTQQDLTVPYSEVWTAEE